MPRRSAFSSRPVRLPKPYFVVFYNGADTHPEQKIFRLSDLYEPTEVRNAIQLTEEQPDLELKTLAININKGYYEKLKKSCQDLYGYMIYVDKVRELAKTLSLEQAVEQAFDALNIPDCDRETYSDLLSA